jgi:hypothetical protein
VTTPLLHRQMRSARVAVQSDYIDVQESGCRLFVERLGGSKENDGKPLCRMAEIGMTLKSCRFNHLCQPVY